MITVHQPSFRLAYCEVVQQLRDFGSSCSPRGKPTRELQPFTSVVDPWMMDTPDKGGEGPFLLYPKRGLNYAFGLVEAFQILRGYTDLEQLSYYNPRMTQFSNNGRLSGAYGPRLRLWGCRDGGDPSGKYWQWSGASTDGNLDQLRSVVLKLRADQDSRQAVALIWDPGFDSVYSSKDYPCNIVLMFKVRNARLNLTVIRRSSDLVWGVPYDHLCFRLIQQVIANTLGFAAGQLVEFSDSLHYYEQQYVRTLDRTLEMKPERCTPDVTGDTAFTLDEFDANVDRLNTLESSWRRGNRMSGENIAETLKSNFGQDSWFQGAVTVIAAWHFLCPAVPVEEELPALFAGLGHEKPWRHVAHQTLRPRITELVRSGVYASHQVDLLSNLFDYDVMEER